MPATAANALAGETSPYLLQHAHNPVDWYPWSDEALAKARREDKPILLSIGYSACHWCHVMAHESFEDPATAAVMNALFVNIKVDREERPDLDRIYQRAHQLLTQRPGGWPLTLFLTPEDQAPFFGGTYFPKEPRFQLPAFTDLLRRVAEVYRDNRDDLRRQNAALVEALQSLAPRESVAADTLSAAPLDGARTQLLASVDWEHGGFGHAPKFPHPTSIERLLRHWAATGGDDHRALEAARLCLRRIALGGIHDHLGGGFCRYSVDDRWMIPHFEKMLYDNGPLLALYAQAYVATGEPLFRDTALDTARWVMREMQSPEGGYYSSQDADSEGEEGRFYVWGQDEVRALLDADEYRAVAARFGLDREANFEGRWHLHVYRDWPALVEHLGESEDVLRARIDGARAKLFAARERRVRPGRDDKILTSWNGLMIRGMASAARHLGKSALAESATRAVEFIRAALWRDGRLLATYKDGRAHLNAYLDDYVYLIDGLLELAQVRWRDDEIGWAMALADGVLEHFQDRDTGGFFFTADDHEALLERPKVFGDESIPAGNGIAAQVLGRLGHLLGETRYLDAAERTLRGGWRSIEELPYAHGALLGGLEEYLCPPEIVVLRGPANDLAPWHERCARPYAPRRMSVAIPGDAAPPALLAQRRPLGGMTGYVCSGTQCQAPVTEIAALESQLQVPAFDARAAAG